AVYAPSRNPVDLFDLSQRSSAKRNLVVIVGVVRDIPTVFIFFDCRGMRLVHRDEPLRRGSENHRVLTPPAMRIAMVVLFGKKQNTLVAHEINDLRVGFKHALNSEVFYFRRKPTGRSDEQTSELHSHS